MTMYVILHILIQKIMNFLINSMHCIDLHSRVISKFISPQREVQKCVMVLSSVDIDMQIVNHVSWKL